MSTHKIGSDVQFLIFFIMKLSDSLLSGALYIAGLFQH